MLLQYFYPDNPNGLRKGQSYKVVSINESSQGAGIFATVWVDSTDGRVKVKEQIEHFNRISSTHLRALPGTQAAKVFGLTNRLYICYMEERNGVEYVKCKVFGVSKQPGGHLQTFILQRNFASLDE